MVVPDSTLGETGHGPRPGDGHVRELLGKAVRVRREKAGLTQAEAAGALGVDERTVRRWEGGEGSLWTGGPGRTVDDEMMRKLRDVYDCRISELVPRNQYPSAPLDPVERRAWVDARNRAIRERV